MGRKKDFWETKATIHIPLKEKEIYILDLIAEQEGKRRNEVIEEMLRESKKFQMRLKKEFSNDPTTNHP